MSDSDAKTLRATRATLRNQGYTVTSFATRKEIVDAARIKPPDLMVLNIGAGTRKLCAQLKADAQTNHVPIIVSGQHANLKHMIDAISYGADGWLLKPLDSAEMLAKVKALVRLRADHQELLETNRHLREEERKLARRNSELEALCGLNQELASAVELRGIITALFNKSRDLLAADRCYLQMLSESAMRVTDLIGPDSAGFDWRQPNRPIEFFGTIFDELKKTKLPIHIANAKNSGLVSKALTYGENLKTVLLLPLTVEDRLIGVLWVCRDKVDAFDGEQLHAAEILAGAASTAIHGARLLENSKDLQTTLRAVIEWADSGLIMVDSDRNIRAANRKLGELLGVDHEKIIGSNERESVIKKAKWLFKEPQAFEERLDWLRRQSAEVVTDHLQIIKPKPRSLERFSGPVFDAGGNFMGRIDIYHDVTVRKASERRIRNLYKRERKIAQILQKNLLPKSAPALSNYDVGTKYSAAVQGMVIGGDYYDFIYLSDDYLAFTLGDVCGKGMAAAVQTYLVKYSLRAFAREDPDPAIVISRLNWTFCQEVEDGAFVTLVYALLDQRNNSLRYCVAGHPQPLIWRPAKMRFEKLGTNGGIVGVVSDALYQTRTTRMDIDDIAVFYTDGITEARSGMGFFGEESLKEIIKAGAACGAQELADMIFAGVNRFTSNQLNDDAAIVVLKRTA